MMLKAIFFDVDGVLLDTLTPHIQVCVDLSNRENLGIKIPGPEAFKSTIVRKGATISPMRLFFICVGFSGEALNRAVEYYDENFARDYELPVFEGVEAMLYAAGRKFKLGIVTSNVLANIERPLGENLRHFEPDCVFTDDMMLTKSEALTAGASNLGIEQGEILFVGDQERDRRAAEDAGTQFLGVTYGWQFDESDEGLNLVNAPSEILPHIFEYIVPHEKN